MPPKIPRPYIKSSHRLDLHKQHNSGPESRALLEKLAAFLSAAGFGRVTEEKQTKKKRMMQVDCNVVVEESKKEGEATSSSTIVEAIHSSATKCNSPKHSSTSSKLAQLGLRSMLRLLQRSEPPKKTQDSAKKPTMVLLDADLLGPSAVANIFALFALSSPDVPFFVLTSLSSCLSAALNFPRCSTVTLLQVGNGADSADDEATVQVQQLCQAIRTTLKPIGLTDRKAAKQQQQRFKAPELAIPVGKAGKKKKKRAKKRNLLL